VHPSSLRFVFVLAAASILAPSVPAFAVPIGTLATTACSGQGVTITSTLIDWLPAGGGTGCVDTTAPTNIAYTGGGPLLPGSTGTIKDLAVGVTPVIDFMTFAGHPNLHFDLTSFFPGVANTACSNDFDPTAPVCAMVAGSSLNLVSGYAGTTLTLAVRGVARDSSGTTSNWQGQFSMDFAGETPFDVQQRFLTTGTLTTGHAGSFTARLSPTGVAEPGSLALLGSGLLACVLGRRRIGSRR
jgi:PEP-CTERM motif